MNITTDGPVKHTAPCYIKRQLVNDVLHCLEARLYTNIRGGSQTGKTSTAYHVMAELAARGHSYAYIDLSQIIEPGISEQQWLMRIATSLVSSLSPKLLRSEAPEPPTTCTQFPEYLYQLISRLPADSIFVLILDRITVVPEYLHVLFHTIRAMYDSRARPDDQDLAERTQFLFVGSFDPERFIEDNSPFNITKESDFDTIDYDFEEESVRDLAMRAGVAEHADTIYHLTAGHPYLTTMLIKDLQVGRNLDAAVEQLFRDPHFGTLRRLLIEDERVRESLKDVLASRHIQYWLGQNRAVDRLILRGVIRPNKSRDAVIRCLLYQQWAAQLSFAQPQESTIAGYITDDLLRTHVEQLVETAKASIADFPVLSPICMGMAIEAVLLNILDGHPKFSQWVQIYNQSAAKGQAKVIKPNTTLADISFSQMIDIAQAGGLITQSSVNIAHGLRVWRNLVHPNRLRQDYPNGFSSSASEAAYYAGRMLLEALRP